MKKSNQVINLPIVSIEDGDEIGLVKNLVINPETGSADFITIEHVNWQVSVKAIPFKKIVGIGEYAVMIESKSSILDLNEIPIANQLISKNVHITSTKLVTRKGELLGEAEEYYIDEETGKVLGIVFPYDGEAAVLEQDGIMTYGENITIITDQNYVSFITSLHDFGIAAPESADTDLSSPPLVSSPPSDNDQQQVEAQIGTVARQQIELLQGKVVQKDIYGMNGQLLFHAGHHLSEEDVKQVQGQGPGVVVDVTMNVSE
ncbi:PRC-barrel domain-containing protein [Pontibacillus salicampi]|uniref:PRC-barrel domain-containing protein n=1 Tax=Pontibacillus salicampi TaxID=1449801 RepID=A0ABV6LJA8_9BACI